MSSRREFRFGSNSKLEPSPSVHSLQEGERTILLDLRTSKYFGLNPTGTDVWECLGSGASVSSLLDALATRWNVPREDIEGEAIEFLALLHGKGLVVGVA